MENQLRRTTRDVSFPSFPLTKPDSLTFNNSHSHGGFPFSISNAPQQQPNSSAVTVRIT
jgi:hypothetical protein